MAPEIMQHQKYDAKADLWSVGTILFQLVTGKTPFTGINQMQLLQNIEKSTELYFPPDKNYLSSDCIDLCRKLLRRNPVERLTFEELFNHPFLSQRRQPDESLRTRRSSREKDGFSFSERNPVRNTEETSQEDCLPFNLDDDSSGPDGSPSFVRRRPSMKFAYGFSLDKRVDRREVYNTPNDMDLASKYSCATQKLENTSFRLDNYRPSEGNLKESLKSMDQRQVNIRSRVEDSLELIDQDYVFVSGPPMDVSSSSASASKLIQLPCKSESPPQASANINSMSSAMPIIGAAVSRVVCAGSLESHCSIVHLPSQELVNKKIKAGRQLEAFSIQLVILAIWKQALLICHTQAASAMEGSLSQETTRLRGSTNKEHGSSDIQECLDTANTRGSQDIGSQIEREFLLEVANAEELSKVIQPGNTEMPDAMETIFQSALAFGRIWGC
ncbi:hypothetical protein F0562_016667 [Nyssa sinensis]|uniref:Protein kinase domain-containing protein n=1 Tax=Nyssa sinensis TaxID=561372 RepID=A0A5J4ZEY5_9ASTE|nr:hypothetical protein F0562_016667 [Nyssa sinensis]